MLAQEKCQSEYLKISQEKEQQESLALEELELQKKAILTESENKLRDAQQEAETYRTVSLCGIQAPVFSLVVEKLLCYWVRFMYPCTSFLIVTAIHGSGLVSAAGYS